MNISRNLTDSFHHKKGVVTRTLPKFKHVQPIEQYNIENRHIDAWKKGWTNETSTHHDGNGLQTVVVVVIVVVFLPLRLTVYQISISVLWNFNFHTGNKYTVEPRLTTTPFIRPPRYYGHILSNQK